MTFGQRKAHKYIWLLLAIIVPSIMVLAMKDLKLFSSKRVINSKNINIDPNQVGLKVFENDLVKAVLSENEMVINLKTALKSSSSIVYEMNDAGKKSHMIGQLTTEGTYKFKINNQPKGIIISDDLKNVDITKLSF